MTRPDLLCIGAALWDVIGITPRSMALGADVPGRIRHVPGGVALNVALACAAHGLTPALLGVVGADAEGDALVTAMEARGVNGSALLRDAELPTDCYMAIEDCAGLIAAIADAHSLERAGARLLTPLTDGRLASPDAPWQGLVVLDGNLTEEQLCATSSCAGLRGADLRVVPASPGKAERLAPLLGLENACFYLNRHEAEVLAGRALADAREAAEAMSALGVARVIITDGGGSVAEAMRGAPLRFARPPAVEIARVTGAGDNFLAAHLAAERAGADAQSALDAAVIAAARHVSGKDPI